MRQNSKGISNCRKSILLICIVLATTFFFAMVSDANRLKNNKPPVFAIFTSEENGVTEYIGFGYRVFFQKNDYYGITYLWAGEEDLSVGDPFENKLKVIVSGNLV
ncbi:MAG: hypothetical protein RR565_02675 [Erysipelothrix sp.]